MSDDRAPDLAVDTAAVGQQDEEETETAAELPEAHDYPEEADE